jgi:hypothetical protein
MALAIIASAVCASLNSRVAADDDIRSSAHGLAYAQPFDAVPTTSMDHLAALRGGLRVGALDVEFAANVRTFVNGALVLESTTNLTSGGTITTQSNMPNMGLNPETLSFVGANPSGLAGQMGVVVADSSGVTTALHSVTREQILGVIFTTASNQQIRQEINVDVTVANFGRFQDAARSALFNGRLLGNLGFTN